MCLFFNQDERTFVAVRLFNTSRGLSQHGYPRKLVYRFSTVGKLPNRDIMIRYIPQFRKISPKSKQNISIKNDLANANFSIKPAFTQAWLLPADPIADGISWSRSGISSSLFQNFYNFENIKLKLFSVWFRNFRFAYWPLHKRK